MVGAVGRELPERFRSSLKSPATRTDDVPVPEQRYDDPMDTSRHAPTNPARTGAGANAHALPELGDVRDTVIERLPGIVYVDAADDLQVNLYTSPQVVEILGVTPAQWVEEHTWASMLHPEDRDRVLAENEAARAAGRDFVSEYRLVRPDGRLVWIRDHAVLVHDADGARRCWQGVMFDITDLKETEGQLHEAENRYRALVEDLPAIVYVDRADESMITTFVSPQIESILGVSAERYTADPELWARMLHPDDREDAIETYTRGREAGQPFAYEYRLIAEDGRVVWFRDSAVVIPGADGRPGVIQGVMLDITERKAAEERVAFLAYHDNLTGLPNKAMFDELLELSLARARRHDVGVAVLYVDVDNFKLVNDSLGHEAGDGLIVQLSERLKEATRETDLVARQGGDEFLLLLADMERTSPVADGDGALIVAESVANRIQQAFIEPFDVEGTELYLTASIGISVFPIDAPDGATLMKNADTAMYRSKKAGPGGYVMHEANDADALTKLSLSTRLRKAVEQKSWMLHYQPLIDLRTGSMFGVEALIRWPGPNGGLVPPGEFIPLAEEMGLIEAIGDWVVEEIARQDEAWRNEGLALEIGFNLSPRQMWQDDLVDRIITTATSAGMDPRKLTVEITESTAMTDPERTLAMLNGLHERGVKLAIDDFGTGYSSLARLRHMPVDVLKIDRMFVREVHSDPQSASMVSAIIALATNLGMDALAEGIETEEEWRFLAERGCPYGQGYHFARPMPAGEILTMHRRAGLQLVHDGLTG
jgi:diguanylate cyclase (GGDEF)-like protein/PAS domain S-box-containing protein